jgi:DNA/RNA endonuclease YhcR with UshA esterase domain
MRAVILVFGLVLMPISALAQTVKPGDAKSHVGQSVTVEGVVADVHHAASGSAIFLDFGGRYPNSEFAAVIFARDESKFSKIDALGGKTVDVTGPIRLYHGKPEIILNRAAQIKAK